MINVFEKKPYIQFLSDRKKRYEVQHCEFNILEDRHMFHCVCKLTDYLIKYPPFCLLGWHTWGGSWWQCNDGTHCKDTAEFSTRSVNLTRCLGVMSVAGKFVTLTPPCLHENTTSHYFHTHFTRRVSHIDIFVSLWLEDIRSKAIY